MDEKKMLILSDSLALPRDKPELCKYEETYPSLLREEGYWVHQVSIGGATSTTLLHQSDYHKMFNPDIVVIQVGIVDCVPRFMSRVELSICRRLGVLGKKIINIFSRKEVRKRRNITYVNISMFKKNIKEIVDKYKSKQILILGIVPALREYEDILPGVTKKINEYNDYLQGFEGFISLAGVCGNGLMSDFHHLNAEGHKKVFSLIAKEVS